MTSIATAALACGLLLLAAADVPGDKITNLPGYGAPKQDQYSGYLEVAFGCVVRGSFVYFHANAV